MKRALSVLLVLLLAAALLPAGALADGPAVVLSTQGLRVNGKSVDCERYNIDGSNYFQLRDLAYVLSDTGSRFSVSWDGANRCVSIVTGEVYEPVGTEMLLSDYDKIDTAAPSYDSVVVNGVLRTDLSAYKIGGHNYFKLKDLGEALGFRVDYDTPSRTMIVVTRADAWPTPWRVVETFYSNNQGGSEHSVSTYTEEGRLLSTLYECDAYSERTEYFYDDLGYEVENTYDYASRYEGESWEEHSDTVTEYDLWGQAVRRVATTTGSAYDQPSVVETTYTYDERGNLLREENVSDYGRNVWTYTYNERGGLLRNDVVYSDGSTYTVEYERDEDNRVVRMWTTDSDGEPSYSYEYEYEGEHTAKEIYVNGDYRTETTYAYDDRGNVILRHTDSTDWDSETTYAYDEEGRMLESVYYDGADIFITRRTYSAEGWLLRTEYSSPDYGYTEEYTYDAEGNPLTDVYTGSDYSSRTDYAYDPAEGKQTVTTAVTYPAPEELALGDEELTLAVGDEHYLYYSFYPYNCAREAVTWSSSDESVAIVEDGTLIAVGAGTAVITVTSDSGLTDSCTVTVAAEKYTLNVSETDLVLDEGDRAPIRCSVSYVGNYCGYKLRYQPASSSGFALKWGDWENYEIDLTVTALREGTYTFVIQVISVDEQTVYTEKTITLEVKGGNTAEKP